MSDATIHEWFLENLPAYVAGGLTADERQRLSAHAAICAACDSALADAVAADGSMRDLFAAVRPAADYEDSLVRGLRDATTKPVRLYHPAWRFAGGVAAAVVLGFIGFFGSNALRHGGVANVRFPNVVAWLEGTRLDRAGVQQLSKENAQFRNPLRPPAWPRATSTEGLLGFEEAPVSGVVQLHSVAQPSFATTDAEARQLDRKPNDSGETPYRTPRVLLGTNTYTGATTVNGGNLSFTNGTMKAPQGVALARNSGGTVDVNGTTTYTVGGNVTVLSTDGTAVDQAPKVDGKNGKQNSLHYWAELPAIQTTSDAKKTPADGPVSSAPDSYAYYRPADVSGGRNDKEVKELRDGEKLGKQVTVAFDTTNAAGDGAKATTDVDADVLRIEQKTKANLLKSDAVSDLSDRGRKVEGKPGEEKLAEKEDEKRGDDNVTFFAGVRIADAGVQSATPTQNTGGGTSTGGELVNPTAGRKIIRNGTMEFEVDAFDAAAMQVGKIATEEGGYVSSTDSEKLANGKVKGTITLRVPPDRLDTLVLKLRGLGDLKTQKIAAQDVTKQYTDLEGQLKAARTMEERLLDIIKTGKGEVKDLVEAEKQLGIYREKIEQVEGELRYYGNLVSLSTLNVTLFERDIRTPSAAFETEEIQAGVETEDVDKSRQEALKSIDEAKGRVIESTMKNRGAGQYEAHIVAEVAPESAGPVLDRLKQLGRVARLDVDRKQQTTGGQGAPTAAVKLERKATRFIVSLYNLANVEPRETVSIAIAAVDVESAYKAILEAATKDEAENGGRVVSRALNGQRPEQTTANLVIEVRSERADAMDAAIRATGEAMNVSTAENPDVANTTRAKRKFSVTIGPLSQVEPRETQTLTVRAKDVPATYAAALAAIKGDEAKRKAPLRVRTSQLNEQDRQNVSAALDFDLPRGELQAMMALLSNGKDAEATSKVVAHSSDTQNTLDSKVRLTVTIIDASQGPPRESTRIAVEVNDVAAALNSAIGAVPQGSHVVERRETKQPDGAVTGHLIVEVPLASAGTMADALTRLGTVRERESARNEGVPDGVLARAAFDVRLATPAPVVSANKGIGTSLREGWSVSLQGLLFSLQLLVIGIFLVGPFALVAWGLWKMFRRRKAA